MPVSATEKRRSERRTEHLVMDLLTAQGWDTRKPPKGNIYQQHEYKDDQDLFELLSKASKSTGKHAGLPEAIVVDTEHQQPLAVVEAKASRSDLAKAVAEACSYADALAQGNYRPLAIGIAGTESDDFDIETRKWNGAQWVPITYEGRPINWIPNEADLKRVGNPTGPVEIRPTIPPAEVLASKADEINRLLRESDIKDEFRPIHVAAVMLALWSEKGNIRRSPDNILKDVNQACREAFLRAGKPQLAKSIAVNEANKKLQERAPRITSILERLNVAVLTAEHDYLGQLYETFFRYTGGNTIGQYFTPRHIARFLADVCLTTPDDIVLDIACGTGGFFVAHMDRLVHEHGLTRDKMVKIVKEHVIGFESEPTTAALCAVNMILRGDGSTKIEAEDSLRAKSFPTGKANVSLMGKSEKPTRFGVM